jgi:hypothetical protein
MLLFHVEHFEAVSKAVVDIMHIDRDQTQNGETAAEVGVEHERTG